MFADKRMRYRKSTCFSITFHLFELDARRNIYTIISILNTKNCTMKTDAKEQTVSNKSLYNDFSLEKRLHVESHETKEGISEPFKKHSR